METITRTGRVVRLIVTAAVFALLLAGSAWGSDDDFPFGPFSMYAGLNGPDDPAPDLRVEATDADGRTIILNESNAGVRRAEIEGQEAAYIADPARLGALADTYQRLNPRVAPIVKVAMVVRLYEIRDSRATGAWHDEVKAVWERQSA